MEQETRKFAIAQAILLISSRQDITDKTKAVFDLAEQIIKWVGVAPKNDFVPFTPTTPIYTTQPNYVPMPHVYPSPTAVPSWQPPYEVTCEAAPQTK